ncbi:MAG: DUF58 domain-containing protein [Candidatus Poribacteria bacterium]|nr:DUF58 domain-containing protein [Candidatus Poribacteria bacterium]MDE0502921.1 DUF58 domain-containing protein [Candidatus Poribacteria bacterium]
MNEAYRQHLIDGERAGSRYALASPKNVPFGASGNQMGKRPGSSLEFIDHREYQPGDDLRRIDWGGFARSDKLTVKLYRDEVSPHLDIVIDGSCSMALENSPKTRATLGLAAVFATAASNVGYSHAAWMAGDGFRQVDNGANRASVWDGIDFDYRGDLATSFTRLPPSWRPYGLRVLLSDLLFPGDPMAAMFRFAEQATAVVIVQVLAEADVNPVERGNIRLVDSESDEAQEVFVDSGAEGRYRSALAQHQENWHRAAKQAGAVMTTVVAEQILDDWRLDGLVVEEVLKIT